MNSKLKILLYVIFILSAFYSSLIIAIIYQASYSSDFIILKRATWESFYQMGLFPFLSALCIYGFLLCRYKPLLLRLLYPIALFWFLSIHIPLIDAEPGHIFGHVVLNQCSSFIQDMAIAVNLILVLGTVLMFYDIFKSWRRTINPDSSINTQTKCPIS